MRAAMAVGYGSSNDPSSPASQAHGAAQLPAPASHTQLASVCCIQVVSLAIVAANISAVVNSIRAIIAVSAVGSFSWVF